MKREVRHSTLAVIDHLRAIGERTAADRMEEMLSSLVMLEAALSRETEPEVYQSSLNRERCFVLVTRGVLRCPTGPVDNGAILTTYTSLSDWRVQHMPTSDFTDGRFSRVGGDESSAS